MILQNISSLRCTICARSRLLPMLSSSKAISGSKLYRRLRLGGLLNYRLPNLQRSLEESKSAQ